VGRAALEVLEDHDLPVESLRALASGRGAGTTVPFRGDDLRVEAVQADLFRGVDLALLAVPAEVARAWGPAARAEGALVVDASAAFRADPEVPLVVPEVNPEALGALPRGIAASPCGLSVALPLVLRPLGEAAGIARASALALESASGLGQRGVEQLEREAHALMNGREPEPPAPVPFRLAFNLVPEPPGDALAAEVRRVLGEPGLPLSVGVLRVPVFYGHAAAVTVVTKRRLPLAEAREALRRAAGLKLVDQAAEGVYPMPMLAVNDDAVHVGRLREDPSQENGLELLLAVDNLRKGGATNLVQLAALVAARHLRPQ
jgi:aspartate-semialdehyde dehydrogenase